MKDLFHLSHTTINPKLNVFVFARVCLLSINEIFIIAPEVIFFLVTNEFKLWYRESFFLFNFKPQTFNFDIRQEFNKIKWTETTVFLHWLNIFKPKYLKRKILRRTNNWIRYILLFIFLECFYFAKNYHKLGKKFASS